jgi:hypothetical protein
MSYGLAWMLYLKPTRAYGWPVMSLRISSCCASPPPPKITISNARRRRHLAPKAGETSRQVAGARSSLCHALQ